MLELIGRKKEQDSNSTLCNLNVYADLFNVKEIKIVIVHYVI